MDRDGFSFLVCVRVRARARLYFLSFNSSFLHSFFIFSWFFSLLTVLCIAVPFLFCLFPSPLSFCLYNPLSVSCFAFYFLLFLFLICLLVEEKNGPAFLSCRLCLSVRPCFSPLNISPTISMLKTNVMRLRPFQHSSSQFRRVNNGVSPSAVYSRYTAKCDM